MQQAIQGPGSITLAPQGRHERAMIPAPRELARPHLARRIEQGMSGRLVLLTAPAGWGKTSLLAEWAQATSFDVAWVDCARYGESGSRIVKGIVAALEAVCPDFGKDLYAMLRSARPLPTPQIFSVLDDALEDYGDDVVLVLDGFQAIEDQETLDAIFGLITGGPNNLRVVIATRMAPTWPLARMRVSGDVTELGSHDLSFSTEEIKDFFGNGSLPSNVVTALHERSGGWPAGVQLARIWMRGSPDAPGLLTLFDGNHRDVGDYMAQEVMASLPEEVRRFLYATSLLPRFSQDLAETMLQSGTAAESFRLVERQDLFLVPMDGRRQWFRYHDLFREFLRRRTQSELGEARHEMVSRAAEWFRREGMALEATTCFLEAGLVDEAAATLDACAQALVLRDGETTTLIDVAERLPSGLVTRFDNLQRFYAWSLVLVGRLDDAVRIAADIEQRASTLDADNRQYLVAEAASIRSRIAAYRGDHAATVKHGLAALQCRDDGMDWFRADALLSIGFAHRATGALSDACDAFGRASGLGWRSHFANAALWGSRYQALTFIARGQLEDASAQIEQDMVRAREAGMTTGAAFAALLVTRGEIRYERNDLAGARQDLSEALRLARSSGDAKILMNVNVALAALEFAEGHRKEARNAARTAVRVFDGTAEKAVEARLCLMDGDLSGVRRWMESYIGTVGDEPSLQHGDTEQLMLARALLATGEAARARTFLISLLEESYASDRAGTAMLVRAVLAQVEDALGSREDADEHARQVIDLAMRERYVRSVLDEGPGFLGIVRRAMRHDASAARRGYARAILPQVEDIRVRDDVAERSGNMEPLTPRQREVLRLMADGRSNREIADELYLAEGTVKAHLHQIFNKLMVRNRAEAIRAAQRLGIAS